MKKTSKKKLGRIIAIAGPMFSGKSTELLETYNAISGEKIKCQIFSSNLDVRYGKGCIHTHDGRSAPAAMVATADELRAAVRPRTQAVFIDEPHLISGDVAALCAELAAAGKEVYVSGLDLDFRGKPFKVMSDIMAQADQVHKHWGACAVCGRPARHSYRKVSSRRKLLVGADDLYEPRCRACFKEQKK